MLERESFRRAVSESGLSKNELARVFEVSRGQIYNILGGCTPPAHRAQRINIYSRAILKLVEMKILPLPLAVKGQQRADAIQRLIRKLYELARPE